MAVLVLVNTVAVLGIGYYQFLLYEKMGSETTIRILSIPMPKEGGRRRSKATGFFLPWTSLPSTWPKGTAPGRFVRLKIVLKFSKDSKEEEFKARKPQIRDSIINTLNS